MPFPVAICTACCQPLTDAAGELPPVRIDLVAIEAADAPQPVPVEQRPSVDHHPRLASAGVGNGLGLITNRGAGFNPLRISTAPPPPNRFRAADERLRARVQASTTSREIPRIQPTSKWVEPEPE
ncbi:MAG TPA: hypothetical protein VHD81_04895 [Mycobacteriales bacterium]|nr:hypothetical protein [Mycobacteriales bacterium]